VAVAVPPLSVLARRYEFVEAFQFAAYAMAVPALFGLGVPRARLGSLRLPGEVRAREAARTYRSDGSPGRRPAIGRSALSLGLFMGAVVAWRTPLAVDAIERHPWLLTAEAVSLVLAGGVLWLELVHPRAPGPLSARPLSATVATLAMWTVWTVAYLVGFSSSSWYTAFPHVAGRWPSLAADQQFSTAVLWLVATVTFLPVVFWDVLAWLRSDEQQNTGTDPPVTGSEHGPAISSRSAGLDL
jgi:cytochrome c oxidase assembly factor CtaG